MTHREFIELLNLYVDHEISEADVERLEAEVLAHPERRAIYHQYCRMQKACATLGEQFRELAPAAPADAAVVAGVPRRNGSPLLYATGFAVAACAAIAFILHRPPAAPAPAPAAALAAVADSAARPEAEALQPVLPARADALFVSAAGAPQLDWINQVHLDPVQRPVPTDQLFAFKPDLKPQTGALPRSPGVAPTEMTAFQVRK
jgi:hypothetical protein